MLARRRSRELGRRRRRRHASDRSLRERRAGRRGRHAVRQRARDSDRRRRHVDRASARMDRRSLRCAWWLLLLLLLLQARDLDAGARVVSRDDEARGVGGAGACGSGIARGRRRGIGIEGS